MMFFKSWLFAIVAAAMVLSLLYAMVPKGAILTAAKCTGGLILLLVMLRPLVSLQWEEVTLPYEYWAEEITVRTEELTQSNRREMESRIQEECSAYISEKAAQLGLAVCAEIRCCERDGIPFPTEVTMDIPYHAALSQMITQDLGIAPQDQYWREAGDER